MTIYTPSRASREAWSRIQSATGTNTVQEALQKLVERNLSEREVVDLYRISRWPLRTACEVYGLKLNDGRKK